MKTKDKVIDIFIPTGENIGNYRSVLDNGHIVGADLHTNHNDIDNLGQIYMVDDAGTKVMSKVNFNHWKKREGAGFLDSLKPICLDTDNKVFEFIATTKAAVIKDTYVQIVLIYKQ